MFQFDQAIDRPLLMHLIERIEQAGAQVSAVVSDMGPKNRGLWRDLNIGPTSTSFANPSDSSR